MESAMRPAQVALVVGTGLFGAAASADIIQFTSDTINSTEGLGAFEGSLDYDPTQARLTISITNTSSSENGGFITGLAFRVGSDDPSVSAIMTTATEPFVGLGVNEASPFGNFLAGVALGGDWLGGGSPQDGIAVGATGTFEFAITATDAAMLTALDFMDVPSLVGPDFIVRFRGFGDGGSDKVPARPDEIVPAPGGLIVLAAAGVFARRRRRK
jgi:MYXO-CTERM domain-containing protein